MDIRIALLIGIFLMGIVFIFFIQLFKRKSTKLLKFIPAIVSAFGMAIFYLKMLFVSQGYDAIYDVLVIIILSVLLSLSLIGAIILQIVEYKKA
ncbi:asparagine N-glycosylation enzyme membrane subunit Stt3 [Salirhabdus euzebyi]|uniref:Asparagine N-glycosylation enzyme membrane subunit Stt3 n=1 Tax=Salirhabdus euzebyi TaxID=394506 RepID=A0A841Q2I7_9BACI|nr:hypothetical protein [Salirhabdus euzebyi]MBB6452635.1 asparagine N-glycosylation enzyme membrane subunit Stt3 [Salirhabdus euzebyi]